ncbi:hypothetical protein ACQCSX_18750 [Pseudarthrobacter sp. P1]|uniref:hypothetical protein n=1 Tax=Pseudarthrobacter sp. P1 TaxID=3418418 RepID=UPI003CEB908C
MTILFIVRPLFKFFPAVFLPMGLTIRHASHEMARKIWKIRGRMAQEFLNAQDRYGTSRFRQDTVNFAWNPAVCC